MVALLLMLVVSTTTVDKLSPYRGQPVVSVDIAVPRGEDPVALRRLIEIEPGYLLSTADLERAIKRLYSLGRFSNVNVYAKRLKGAVMLHFELYPIYHLDTINISGLEDVDKDKFFQALHVRSGMEVDSRTEKTLHRRARDFLKQSGFPSSKVSLIRTLDPEEPLVRFTLHVQEGEARRIGKIEFTGKPRIPDFVLRGMIESRPTNILDLNLLRDDRKRLEDTYLSHDFRNVEVAEPIVFERDGNAVVQFSIQANNRISIEFAGNRVISDEALSQLWPNPTGRIRSGDLLTFKERIKTHYQRLGYNRANVELRGFQQAGAGITRYLFQIEEGEPVYVTEIIFEGATVIPPTRLKEHIYSLLHASLGAEGTLEVLEPIDLKILAEGRPSHLDKSIAIPQQPPVPQRSRWVSEIYAEALDQIAAAYRDKGYLNVKVGPAQPTFDGNRVRILIPVSEGAKSSIDSISFRNNTQFASSALLNEVSTAASLNPGGALSASAIEDARISLIRLYRDHGFIYARIFAKTKLSDDTSRADIAFHFEEGYQVRISEILIRGNDYTREGLIRDRISFTPGDIYRLEQALADQRAISELGVFTNARINLIDEDHPSSLKDLIVEVDERDRHQLEIMGGISTEDGPRIGFSYSHLNLLGTATTLKTSFKFNRQPLDWFEFDPQTASNTLMYKLYGGDNLQALRERYQSYTTVEDQLTKALERELQVGLYSPQIMDVPFDPILRVDFVNVRDNKISYSLDTLVAIFGIELNPRGPVKLTLEPQLNRTNLECAALDPNCSQQATADLQQSIKIDNGLRVGFKVGPTVTVDYRDSPINPSRGFMASLNSSYSQGTRTVIQESGTEEVPYAFTKFEGRISGYIPLQKAIFALALWAGDIDPIEGGSAPIDERFFLGGRGSLRGFKEDSLFPEDACVQHAAPARDSYCKQNFAPLANTENGETSYFVPIQGGHTYLLLKSELRLPLIGNLYLDLFFEAGNLWYQQPDVEHLKLRIGTGMGISYATPVGPLSFSVGINPTRRAKNQESLVEYHLAVGQF